ncbi:DUF924 domain-containing protein [Tetragenococcus koreensis]|uniref:DUF924 family protein n=1 Tax=Tetragenococcus koreensis TaxID=290335 RepID=UPI001F4537A5|nr:DUF924 family protein [Tetragenococcus koreensis]MCF1620482.1 DUF924 domain-containing protein [Tetragenococcus koreensis]MCF1657986.1 DUF924 domain-containing protein [Tetragenococcus koreensis]
MSIVNHEKVLEFWFDPQTIPMHFTDDHYFDEIIRERFLETWELACEGLLVEWRATIQGRLAEIIVLDQFSRNLWRENENAYNQDRMAVILAQEGVNHPDYNKLTQKEKKFLIMPFMHSESLALHDWALKYFQELGLDDTLRFENLHRELLEKFCRYPYRNNVLGRESTPEELKALEISKYGFYS